MSRAWTSLINDRKHFCWGEGSWEMRSEGKEAAPEPHGTSWWLRVPPFSWQSVSPWGPQALEKSRVPSLTPHPYSYKAHSLRGMTLRKFLAVIPRSPERSPSGGDPATGHGGERSGLNTGQGGLHSSGCLGPEGLPVLRAQGSWLLPRDWIVGFQDASGADPGSSLTKKL